MKSYFTLILTSCFCFSLFTQVNLKSTSGIGDLPDATDEICNIPEYLDSFEESGFFVGDTIPDFNLYDVQGNNYQMSSIYLGRRKTCVDRLGKLYLSCLPQQSDIG